MSLPQHIWWWLVRDGKTVAAERPSSFPDRRAWIAVYPIRYGEGGFNVQYFEVRKDLLDAGYDIANNELLNNRVIHVNNEEELEQLLISWIDDLSILKLPYFCDYPM